MLNPRITIEATVSTGRGHVVELTFEQPEGAPHEAAASWFAAKAEQSYAVLVQDGLARVYLSPERDTDTALISVFALITLATGVLPTGIIRVKVRPLGV